MYSYRYGVESYGQSMHVWGSRLCRTRLGLGLRLYVRMINYLWQQQVATKPFAYPSSSLALMIVRAGDAIGRLPFPDENKELILWKHVKMMFKSELLS